jgi:glyoxylase-like metal-dependent hydrolase (beta-lactamase superfamily II)
MQITKHIHALKIPFKVNGPVGAAIDRFVYVFLIYGKTICLVDTGVAGSKKMIFDYIEKTGRKPEEISQIVLTHSHPDHIGGAQSIERVTGCAIAAHIAEKSWIEDVALQSRERPVPGFDALVEGSVRISRLLQGGDVLDLDDNIGLEVFHTPGHSSGSISLMLREDATLFSGDAVPIVGDLPIYEDIEASARSIEKLKGIKGVNFLLASWDEPRRGEESYRVMDDGLSYLKHIHKKVIETSRDLRTAERMELCKHVLAGLGLPATLANPIVLQSFEASLRVQDNEDLS